MSFTYELFIKKNTKNTAKLKTVSNVDLNLSLGDKRYPPKITMTANINTFM